MNVPALVLRRQRKSLANAKPSRKKSSNITGPKVI